MQKLRLLILLLLQIILFAQAEQDIPWFAGAASRSGPPLLLPSPSFPFRLSSFSLPQDLNPHTQKS